ncbi:MAG: hypothetical protein R3249_01570 [Nitriliruptorales bacterium]|nr:hypothetical protein [Nitriliruptorales bacterium]
MRRAILILLGALALALVAGPSVATETHESEPAHESEVMTDESDHGSGEKDGAAFGEGEWDGLVAAGAVAAVFGLIVFAFSNIGVKDEPAEDTHY